MKKKMLSLKTNNSIFTLKVNTLFYTFFLLNFFFVCVDNWVSIFWRSTQRVLLGPLCHQAAWNLKLLYTSVAKLDSLQCWLTYLPSPNH